MNKKICALLLSAAMCFCFTACSADTQAEQDTTTTAVTTAEVQTTTVTQAEETTATESTSTEKATSEKSTKAKASTTAKTTTAKSKTTTAKAKTATETSTKNKKVAVTKKKVATTKKKKKSNTVTCTVTVECKSILSHMDKLKEGHEEFVPGDGYIIKDYTYKAKKGYTAYDALKAACDNKSVKLTSQKTAYGIYISGINNLDEFDCGSQSGWMYKVNDKYPNTTCGNITISENDTVVFEYVCSYQQ